MSNGSFFVCVLAVGMLLGYGIHGAIDATTGAERLAYQAVEPEVEEARPVYQTAPASLMAPSTTQATPAPRPLASSSTANITNAPAPKAKADPASSRPLVQQSTGTICQTNSGECTVPPQRINSICRCGSVVGQIVR